VFRVIQLAGPTAREAEEQVAKYIEEQVALYDQRDLGTRTRRDGNGGLRIDFTYDAATPPVAMEITALVQPDRRALGSELRKLEAELREVVCAEYLGAWLVSVRVGTDVRRLRPPLVELLRRQRTRNGIVLFHAGEAPDDLAESDRRLLTELLDLGLFSALRLDQGNQVSVSPPISSDAEGDDGFGTQLQAVMAANVDKLREAKPRETHLVVTLDRSDLSADPARTPVPDLLEGIDVLWVLLGYYNAKWTYGVWRTMTGDSRWQLLADPLGEPPTVYPSTSSRDQPPLGRRQE
jgi:hypothetical protein